MNNENITPNNSLGSSSRVESFSFYIFLATIILAPLVFWLNPYITQDLIKTFVIAIGVIVTAILIGFVAMKEKSIPLLPKSLCRISTFLAGSIIISSLLSIHASKSLFGQGFEIGSASFILILMLAGFSAFTLVGRHKDRAVVLYVGVAVTYLVVFVLHLLRIIFGPKFMTLGILNSSTASIVGGWFNLATFSAIIFMISILAVIFLRLSKRTKIIYWVLAVISFIGTVLVADIRIWQILTLVFLGISICLSILKWNAIKQSGLGRWSAIVRSLAWVPIVVFVVSALLVWRGPSVIGPLITKMNIAHMELVLPWQMTLGVTASVMQSYPLFGVGSNNFSQAYLTYKPIQINATNAWSAEFSSGFGYIPTFVATHGVVGSILWVLLFVFFGIISTKILRNLPVEADRRFMVVSSFVVSVFLILVAFVSVPSHSILLLTFTFIGIFLGTSRAYGLLPARSYTPAPGSKMFKILVALAILILVVWGLIYFKKTIAFTYFGSGVKVLNSSGDLEKIDRFFSKALKLDQSDVYWRGKAEVALVAAQKMADGVTPATSASTTQAILSEINNILNQGLASAKKATTYDPANYYNFLSEARVSEVAATVKMQNGYESAVSAYNSAINLNPYNPSVYLSLANLQARQAKYDDALQTLGKALQVKNNYLDAVFLLSQVYAAKGDTSNAIVAAKVAVQLNPQNSILLFQLGILDYNIKDYAGAIQALTDAIKYQPDYANAKYFLGLSHARLNHMAEAITLFEELSLKNPDNQEVALILSNLRSGRSIFTDTKAPATPAPEKRSSLPIKEKK